MDLKEILITNQRSLVLSANFEETGGASHNDFVDAVAEAVSFARASRVAVQVLVSVFFRDEKSLREYCSKLARSLELGGETLEMTIARIDDWTCKLTVKSS